MENKSHAGKGMTWEERGEALGAAVAQHIKKIVAVVILALAVFGVSVAIDSYRASREQKLTAEFYRLEKKYTDAKKDYEKKVSNVKTAAGKDVPPPSKDKKTAKPSSKDSAQKMAATDAAIAAIALPNYTSLAGEIRDFALQNKKTRTGKQAAILASRIMTDTDQGKDLKDFLVQFSFDSHALVDFLGENLKAQVLANQDGCNEAAAIWKKLLTENKAQFLWAQAQIGIGLCAEKRGDNSEATSYFNQAIAQAKDSASARSAEKYLRTLAPSLGKAGSAP